MLSPHQMPKVALINDTSLYSNHFGCDLVCQVFREQFCRVGLDLILTLPKRFNYEEYAEELSKADLLVLNGEGTLHHNKFQQLVDLADKCPSVLVNCVFEQNAPNPNLKKFLYISARESYSAKEIQQHGANCDVVPDLIFASTFARLYPQQKATKRLGVTDNVVKEYHGIWPFRIRARGIPATGQTAGIYLKKLSSYRRIACGRFHAAVLCCVRGIPFATWDSNSWKTRALMQDMGISQLHFDSRQEAIKNVPNVFPDQIKPFVEEARLKIDQMFDRIRDIAIEQQKLRHEATLHE